MNVIEKEIQKRKDLIVEREAKLAEAQELEAKAQALRQQYEPISVDELQREIAELEGFISELGQLRAQAENQAPNNEIGG